MARVQVVVTIAAEPATVFKYFSDAARFVAWFGPGATIQASVGGAMRIPYPNGSVNAGRVVEVQADKRIVFTWGFEGASPPGYPAETRVSVELAKVTGGTRVTLVHDGLPDGEWTTGTEGGWNAWLAQLSSSAMEEELRPKAERAVDAYIAAWNEDDDAARAVLIESCWAVNGQFRDRYAAVDGRDAIALHIRRSRQLMPGVLLDRTQPLWMSREYGRFGWSARMADGTQIASGDDFARFAMDGKIELMVGFWAP